MHFFGLIENQWIFRLEKIDRFNRLNLCRFNPANPGSRYQYSDATGSRRRRSLTVKVGTVADDDYSLTTSQRRSLSPYEWRTSPITVSTAAVSDGKLTYGYTISDMNCSAGIET